jgi:hypothetical protein
MVVTVGMARPPQFVTWPRRVATGVDEQAPGYTQTHLP